MAPAAALEPYSAEAVDPFNTVMLSISSGFIDCRLSPWSRVFPPPSAFLAPWSSGMPFTTSSGELVEPEKPTCPRSRICVLAPAPAAGAVMLRPATLPSSDSPTLVVRLITRSSVFTDVAAYPNFLSWRLMPRAVTTTTSISPGLLLAMLTDILISLPTVTSCMANPT